MLRRMFNDVFDECCEETWTEFQEKLKAAMKNDHSTVEMCLAVSRKKLIDWFRNRLDEEGFVYTSSADLSWKYNTHDFTIDIERSLEAMKDGEDGSDSE